MTSIAESDITCPHSVWFTSFLFTNRAGRKFMLMHANHSFMPAFGTVGPLSLLTVSINNI